MRVQTEGQIILAVITMIGIAAVSLVVRAFVLIAQSGGWVNTLKRTDAGHWPVARWLLVIGLLIGVVFAAMITWLARLNLSHWPH